jgi:hypothetical protein
MTDESEQWEKINKELDVLIALENCRRDIKRDMEERAKRNREWAAEVEAYHQRARRDEERMKQQVKQSADDLPVAEEARKLLRFGLERRIQGYRQARTAIGENMAAELQKQLTWVDGFSAGELAARVRKDPEYFIKLAKQMRNDRGRSSATEIN